MIDVTRIKGILFDYGGTIDSNGIHWSEVIWQAYQDESVPVTKDVFRQAYVYGERTMGQIPLVKPEHTFADMMRIKMELQIEWLCENRYLTEIQASRELKRRLVGRCYAFAARSTAAARPIIKTMAERYPLAMVSNFYGNMASVLKDFRLDTFFQAVIESAVAGVRKPDPQLFRLGVDALKIPASRIAVIGDSYEKDILPAASLHCQTIWLKNISWNDYTGKETADVIISDFSELKTIFQ